MNRFWIYVLIAALAVNMSAGWFYGFDKPMESDAKLYLQIARSVADGDGYRLREGFWPDEPTMSRAPGWPLLVAGALRAMEKQEGDRPGGAGLPQGGAGLPNGREIVLAGQDSHGDGAGLVQKGVVGVLHCSANIGGHPDGDLRPEYDSNNLTTKQPNNSTTAPVAADSIMRLLCLLLNALNAVLVFLLTFTLTRNNRMALIAGALYLFYPTALYHAVTGASEILFVTLTLVGVILWQVAGGKWHGEEATDRRLQTADIRPEDRAAKIGGIPPRADPPLAENPPLPNQRINELTRAVLLIAGALLLGLATLVRLNFVILPVVVIAIGMEHCVIARMRDCGRKGKTRDRRLKTEDCRITSQNYAGSRMIGFGVILAAVLFILPVSLWAVRNYRVSGEFPVLSTIGGQTFYGGNNEVVSSPGEYWGYWVFPDSIPGEKPMRELSATMSELEVDGYYNAKGKEYLRSNWAKVPGLLTGKLIRAYVPIPWKWTKGLIVVNAYRLLLYVFIVIGAIRLWQSMPRTYRGFAVSMFAVSMITTLIFWGSARFTFAVEPIFIPLASFWAMKREKK